MRSATTRWFRAGSVAAALAAVGALLPVRPARAERTGPVEMRLVPVAAECAAGAPISLWLELRNRGSDSVRVWMAEPGHGDGWDLELWVSRPPGGPRVLVPGTYYQMIYLDAPKAVVGFAPGESRRVMLVLAEPDPWSGRVSDPHAFERWNAFTPDELRQARRTGSHEVHEDVLTRCFDRPGRYRLTARLDLTHDHALSFAGLAGEAPPAHMAGRPPLVRELLRAGPVTIRVLPRPR